MDRKRKGIRVKNFPWALLPGLLLVSLWPCIVHMRMADTQLSVYPWFPNIQKQGDFFLYDRGTTLIVLAVWMMLVILDRMLLTRTWHFYWKRWIPLVVYLVLAVLSACFSEYRDLAFSGVVGQYESIWILVSYGVIVIYFSYAAEDQRSLRLILCAFILGAFLQMIFGIFQLLGFDFWDTSFGRDLLTLGISEAGKLEFAFEGNTYRKVYLAMYNPNYAGVYCVLLLPICGAMFGFRKRGIRLGMLFLTAFFLLLLVGSGSKTGMVVCGALFVGTAVFMLLNQRRYRLFCGMIVLLLGSFLLFLRTPTFDYLKKGFLKSKPSGLLQEIALGEDRITIRYADTLLHADAFLLSENELMVEVLDEKEESVPLRLKEDGTYAIDVQGLRQLRFDAVVEDGKMNLLFYQGSIPWIFTKSLEGGQYSYTTIYEKTDTIEAAAALGFKGKEKLFSDRGYIFSRTFPLLKNYLLLGSGPDTFAVVFPQNDYVARANIGERMFTEILTRPHNMYLQIWVQTGLLSLVAFLVFVGIYFWKNRWIWTKVSEKSENLILQRGIYVSVLGYLAMGLMNDSMVVTTPLFMMLLGLGMAMERLQKKRTAV